MLEFIRELRDLCDKYLVAEKVATEEPKAKKKKPKDDEKVETPATLDDVRSSLIEHSKKHGKENTFRLLLSFNAKTVSEVKEKDYPEILAKARL
jgi:hypothetical protein